MANTLVGLFDDRETAQGAVGDLISAGFSRDSISIVSNDNSGGVATTTDVDGNLAAEGLSSGATSGAVVGGVAGLLIGLGFTVLPIAGVLLAGPIAGLIAGAASGAVTGGVVGGLIGLGIPQEHAEYYAEGIRRGGTLVTVNVESADESRARDILDRDGAADIERRAADWRTQGYTGYDANAKPYDDAEVAQERSRYATSNINSDWNDTANAPAPSADATYAASTTPSTGYTDVTGYGDTGARVRSFGGTTDADLRSDFGTGAHANDYDTDYRSHLSSTNPSGDYDRYRPAYDYGRQLADDPAYASGDWSSNETSYRSRWEERNPGTWDEFKASVRHAYDKAKATVTGENGASVR